MQVFAETNVAVVRGIDALNATDSRRLVLLNTDSISVNDIGYTIDSIPGVLTLPVMTEACLRHLDEKNGHEKFFMMVEGGNIDHGGHGNDAGTIIKEVLNFQEAIKVGYDFYLAHPEETLIIITADHETGGMGLGNNIVGYDLHPHYYDYQKVSKDTFSDYCKAIMKSRRIFEWEDMQEFLTEKLGFWKYVPLTDDQTVALKDSFEKCFKKREGEDQKTLYNNFNEFTTLVFRTLDNFTGIGWTTNGHTGGLVPVYAIGAGAEKFASFSDNTDIPKRIRELVGIK